MYSKPTSVAVFAPAVSTCRGELEVRDPLYRDVPLDYVREFPVLGIATTFLSNSPEVARIVERTYSDWTALSEEFRTRPHPGPRTRIVVHDDEVPSNPAGLNFRVPDQGRLLVATSGSFGLADASRRDACAYITAQLLTQVENFVEGIVEPLTLTLLGSLDREPLHASGVVRGRRALLFAGPSGSGKSTLAYAAYREGYQLLGDEVVYTQLDPHLRVWGRRGRINLPPEVRRYFPDLAGQAPVQSFSGKQKIVVDVPLERRCFLAEQVALCLLLRSGSDEPNLVSISQQEAVRRLTAYREVGFDLYQGTAASRIAALAEGGAWLLDVGSDPHRAVSLLDKVISRLE